MIYIPNEWIIDKDNEENIHEIVDSLNTDIITDEEALKKDVIKRLTAIGETKVIENLDKIPFGA